MNLAVICGYSGFIGSHFTRKLLQLGWYVYGIDKNHYTEAALEFHNNNNFVIYGDDIAEVKTLPDCDFVFNFAAESHVANSIEDSSIFIHSNVEGVRNLLELIRKKPNNIVKKPVFFHISTDEVYGDILQGEHKETDLLNPSNPYAASKAAADMLILAWARTYGLEYVIARPTNNYGTHQHPEKLIPLTIKLATWDRPVRLHNRGTPKRMWLHVSDTVDAILTLCMTNSRGIFNISGNLEQTNLATVTKVLWSIGFDNMSIGDKLDLDYIRQGQDMRYAIDDSKLKSLGWKCKKHFDDEIQNIVSWYLANVEERLFL